MYKIFLIFSLYKTSADIATEEIQFLNGLPIDKLVKLKSSLQDLVEADYGNLTVTTTSPTYLQSFGAEAMAMKGPPIKRGDYEEEIHKHDGNTKISNIFSMSVTTLAFLAFGGYLLCLIVQAVKNKQMYNMTNPNGATTVIVNSKIKKRPHAQFSSYGRRRRDNREERSLRQIDLPPEQLFSALLHVCEGYAKWSDRCGDLDVY